ncbi:MAG: hypothetical protein LBH20_08120 [Treponema sp.]|jgi:hypothetical protein|nr:hypothetical protein [Treponema sp.]
MKNMVNLCGIIALAVIIGFIMTACSDDPGDGGGGGKTALGDTPTLSGQVYVLQENPNGTFGFQEYTGDDLEPYLFFDYYLGDDTWTGYSLEGTIKNGQFSCTLLPPETEYLQALTTGEIEDHLFSAWKNVTVSPSTTQGYFFESFDLAGIAGQLFRESFSGSRGSGTLEAVMYMYVDKDATVSGKGKTEKNDYYDEDEDITYTYITTTKDFKMAFKKGWNTIYFKDQVSSSTNKETRTMTISLGNPDHLKWVLSIYDYEDYSLNMSRLARTRR